MRFTVVWTPEMQDDFLNHWLNSDSQTRRRLTEISTAVDHYLAEQPLERSKLIPTNPNVRVCTLPGFFPIVSVIVEIKTEDRLVRVSAIYFAR